MAAWLSDPDSVGVISKDLSEGRLFTDWKKGYFEAKSVKMAFTCVLEWGPDCWTRSWHWDEVSAWLFPLLLFAKTEEINP